MRSRCSTHSAITPGWPWLPEVMASFAWCGDLGCHLIVSQGAVLSAILITDVFERWLPLGDERKRIDIYQYTQTISEGKYIHYIWPHMAPLPKVMDPLTAHLSREAPIYINHLGTELPLLSQTSQTVGGPVLLILSVRPSGDVSMLYVIGLTRLGFELPTFRTRSLCTTDSTTASVTVIVLVVSRNVYVRLATVAITNASKGRSLLHGTRFLVRIVHSLQAWTLFQRVNLCKMEQCNISETQCICRGLTT